jgi:hypothetical protein
MDTTFYLSRMHTTRANLALILHVLAILSAWLSQKRAADDVAALHYIANKYPGALD